MLLTSSVCEVIVSVLGLVSILIGSVHLVRLLNIFGFGQNADTGAWVLNFVGAIVFLATLNFYARRKEREKIAEPGASELKRVAEQEKKERERVAEQEKRLKEQVEQLRTQMIGELKEQRTQTQDELKEQRILLHAELRQQRTELVNALMQIRENAAI
jgi:uncharacterized membrane protein YhiD involved in acid resistance